MNGTESPFLFYHFEKQKLITKGRKMKKSRFFHLIYMVKKMKHLQRYENFTSTSDDQRLKWQVLRFLLRKEEGCSLQEIFGNFPQQSQTEKALQQLILKDYALFDDRTGIYKSSLLAKEHTKTLPERFLIPPLLAFQYW
jgi:hypothetical protein